MANDGGNSKGPGHYSDPGKSGAGSRNAAVPPGTERRSRRRGMALDGELIRRWREERGLSREDFGELIDLTARTVCNAELGAPVQQSTVRALSEAIGVDVATLIQLSPEQIQARLVALGRAVPTAPAAWTERAEAELVLSTALQEGQAVALSGPPGVGKSALAQVVASRLSAHFPDGVAWIGMARAEAQGLEGVLAAVDDLAQAFRFAERLPSMQQVGLTAYCRAFQSLLWARKRLLVLDDVQLPQALAVFAPQALDVPLIVTTSQRRIAQQFANNRELSGLPDDQARLLLASWIGEERLRGDESGTGVLIETLSGTPLGLTIAGRILREERFTRPADYARRLMADFEGATLRHSLEGPTPNTSLLASYLQLEPRLESGDMAFLGRIAPLGEATFPARWAATLAKEPLQVVAERIDRLEGVYLLRSEHAVDLDEMGVRLEGHVVGFARWRAHSEVSEPGLALTELVVSEAERMGQSGDFSSLHRWSGVWSQVLDELFAEPEPGAEHDDRGRVHEVPRRLQVRVISALVALMPVVERSGSAVLRWLPGAQRLAVTMRQPAAAARLALAMGRCLLAHRLDFPGALEWFDEAIERSTAAREFDVVAQAAGEKGRAEAALNRPEAAADAYRRALDAGRAGQRGVALATTLNNAAVTMTRAGGEARGAWELAESLLLEAAAATVGQDVSTRVCDVVRRLNLAIIQTHLGRDGAGDDVADLDALWRGTDLDALVFDVRLEMIRAALSSRRVDSPVGYPDWNRVLEHPGAEPHEVLWVVGEAAFYHRLALEWVSHDAPGGPSPVIAGGFAVTDVTRDIRGLSLEGPLGLLQPVEPFAEVHSPGYCWAVHQLGVELLGAGNRVSAELQSIATLAGFSSDTPAVP